jgi:2-keto-4-pentenoate hydratase
MAFADGETISMSHLLQPRIEGEIAFYLGKDLDQPGITLAEVLSAVEYAVAAIELSTRALPIGKSGSPIPLLIMRPRASMSWDRAP